MTNFVRAFENAPIMLTGGPVVERLKREFDYDIDHENLSLPELIYTRPDLLETLYRQYLDIARDRDLPIMILTPTTRLSPEALASSPFGHRDMVGDATTFMTDLKSSYGQFSNQIFIGGALGCKEDAYSGDKVLSLMDAYRFHAQQVREFEGEPLDFLYANIMPELQEAAGMAMAMSESRFPYIISFMVRRNGRLLDGTPIADAIKFIDSIVENKPLFYMCNCIHPTNLKWALENPVNYNRPEMQRFKGLRSNASTLSPEELDGCPVMQREDFGVMVEEMKQLHFYNGLKVLGGCCGTNDDFLSRLSYILKMNAAA